MLLLLLPMLPQAGSTDVLVDNLPGVPDNIHRASAGGFWVALAVPIKPVTRLLKFRLMRALMAWLPQNLRPSPGRCAGALRPRAVCRLTDRPLGCVWVSSEGTGG